MFHSLEMCTKALTIHQYQLNTFVFAKHIKFLMEKKKSFPAFKRNEIEIHPIPPINSHPATNMLLRYQFYFIISSLIIHLTI